MLLKPLVDLVSGQGEAVLGFEPDAPPVGLGHVAHGNSRAGVPLEQQMACAMGVCLSCVRQQCINCCPAACYAPQPDGTVLFSYEGCVECGTCRIVCNEFDNIEWTYPRGGFGIQYRLG